MGKAAKRIALGTAIAGAAGYVAGLMTAPKSGRETREELAKTAGDGKADIEKQLKAMQSELGKLVDEAKGRGGDLNKRADKELTSLLDKAKDSKDKVREILGAVRSGEASNKDLQKAVKDARHAIAHIRDYLQK